MTPLLRFVVDSKPTGLKEGAKLGIVTAEIPKNRAMGKDKTHEGSQLGRASGGQLEEHQLA